MPVVLVSTKYELHILVMIVLELFGFRVKFVLFEILPIISICIPDLWFGELATSPATATLLQCFHRCADGQCHFIVVGAFVVT